MRATTRGGSPRAACKPNMMTSRATRPGRTPPSMPSRDYPIDPYPRPSIVAPEQACKLALHLYFIGPVILRVVSGIGRIQPDHAILAAQIFQRGLFAAHQRHDDFAVTRRVGTADQGKIAIENTRFDHRVARNFQR